MILPSKDVEKLIELCGNKKISVEYILRKLPQEGLEGEPVDRVREAFNNKYTVAYMGKSNR